MNYENAIDALSAGHAVRLPEWQGYWFRHSDTSMSGLKIGVMTKDGDILDTPWEGPVVTDRTDWEPANGLSFGWAINALKNGKLVARRGWNGKGMFIVKQVPAVIGTDIIPKMQSLPSEAKETLLRRDLPISYTNQMLIVNAKGQADSWVPSSSDVFAEDWTLFSLL